MKQLAMLIACSVLLACGGGTSGSSSTGSFVDKTINEIVRDENGLPLALATVKVVSTGETFKTDEHGSLSIRTPLQVGRNDFVVTATDERVYLLESYVDEGESTATFTVLYQQSGYMRYGRWELRARITGDECEPVFFTPYPPLKDAEEARRWRESSEREIRSFGYANINFEEVLELPRGAQCVLEVEVLKDGAAVPGMRYNSKIGFCYANGEVVNGQPFAEGASDENGRIALPLLTDKSDVCLYDFQIPGWGGLKLGAVVDIVPINPNRP